MHGRYRLCPTAAVCQSHRANGQPRDARLLSINGPAVVGCGSGTVANQMSFGRPPRPFQELAGKVGRRPVLDARHSPGKCPMPQLKPYRDVARSLERPQLNTGQYARQGAFREPLREMEDNGHATSYCWRANPAQANSLIRVDIHWNDLNTIKNCGNSCFIRVNWHKMPRMMIDICHLFAHNDAIRE